MDDARTAEAVRAALVEAAREAYEDAGFAGLCAEGRWERALDAMRALDLDAVTRTVGGETGGDSETGGSGETRERGEP